MEKLSRAQEGLKSAITPEDKLKNEKQVEICKLNDKEKIKNGYKWMVGMYNGKLTKCLVSPSNFEKKNTKWL